MKRIFIFSLFIFYSVECFSQRERIHQIEAKTNHILIAEIAYGKSLAAAILGKYKIYKDKKLNRYINYLGAGIAAKMGRKELNYYWGVLKSNKINSFTCPGGYIFITLGAIKAAKSEAELVGILAHELAHVNRKHIVKALKDKGNESPLASFREGGSSSESAEKNEVLKRGMNILLTKGLRHKMEYEADIYAVKYMYGLGYHPKYYRNFLKRINNSKQFKIISKAHPPIFKRLKVLDKRIKKYKNTKKKLIEGKERFAKNIII